MRKRVGIVKHFEEIVLFARNQAVALWHVADRGCKLIFVALKLRYHLEADPLDFLLLRLLFVGGRGFVGDLLQELLNVGVAP